MNSNRNYKNKKYIVALLMMGYMLIMGSLASCIENDIRFPLEELQIVSVEMEGQSNADDTKMEEAVINKKERTVTLFVNDKVDVARLKVTRFVVTEGATVTVQGYPNFPKEGYTSVGNVPDDMEPAVVDFSRPVNFLLSKYQDYLWTVSVTQVVQRAVNIEGMVGKPVVDQKNRKVVVYVDKAQNLANLKVRTLNLGGKSGSVEPNPTTISNFTEPVNFLVKEGWSENWKRWTVYVYHAVEEEKLQAEVFAKSTSAIMTGQMQRGKRPVVKFRKAGEHDWTNQAGVEPQGDQFQAIMKNLQPATKYEYCVEVTGLDTLEGSFTTAKAEALENGGFEEWHLEKNKIWNPWNVNKESFWDTGNDGAAIVSKSNSVPTSEDTFTGKGKAALLETKDMLGFLAAGNIFTGQYVRTEIPNGVLSFGRPFTSFPTKLRVHYKYKSAPVSHVKEPFMHLKGEPDECFIYIALTAWNGPLEIRTDPKHRQLFDKNDPQVIAYAELSQGTSSSGWETKELELEYRKQVVPTHILVVATASKYGDYFTGGAGSRLLIDDFELIYD